MKGPNESTLGKDSSIPLMHNGMSDLGSLILIQIIPKKCTLGVAVVLFSSLPHKS